MSTIKRNLKKIKHVYVKERDLESAVPIHLYKKKTGVEEICMFIVGCYLCNVLLDQKIWTAKHNF